MFAYGATGAGKTHTMLGTSENPGIIFLTVMELYKKMEELRGTKKFEISVSYLEVQKRLETTVLVNYQCYAEFYFRRSTMKTSAIF